MILQVDSTSPNIAPHTTRRRNDLQVNVPEALNLRAKIFVWKKIWRTTYCWWSTTWDVQNHVNNGISYHTNWCRISAINSIPQVIENETFLSPSWRLRFTFEVWVTKDLPKKVTSRIARPQQVTNKILNLKILELVWGFGILGVTNFSQQALWHSMKSWLFFFGILILAYHNPHIIG